MLDSRPKGRRFEPHRRHCVVSLRKNINPSLVLVQPRKTCPFITERLLMGRKESNQTNISNSLFCRWNHRWFRNLYHISHRVCQNTAPTGRAVGWSQALQRADKLCPGHRKGIWYPRVVQRSQCSTLRIYTKVSCEVRRLGEAKYEDLVTSLSKEAPFN